MAWASFCPTKLYRSNSLSFYRKHHPHTLNVQVSGQLEGLEAMLESQLNITNQILDNVDDNHYIDSVQGIEAVFIAFLKGK